MPLGRLEGKAAIITGGGSGIGRAVCQVFAREGASVAVFDINEEGMQETITPMVHDSKIKHCSIRVDVTSVEQVEKAFKTAREILGKRITILVNCAGILRGNRIDVTTENDFNDVIDVNLKGAFVLSKAFVASLSDLTTKSTRGSLVHMSSLAGIRGSLISSCYSASKFGMIGLTKTVALEYPTHRVRCNAVAPDMIDTPMLGGIDREEASIKQNPMQRLGKPEEVANACLFLASDESSYVNGSCLEVTGGNRC